MTAPALGPKLQHDLSFTDLYDRDGLVRLDAAFVGWLKEIDVDAHARFMAARTAPDALAVKDESNLLIELARPLEDFLGALFGVAKSCSNAENLHLGAVQCQRHGESIVNIITDVRINDDFLPSRLPPTAKRTEAHDKTRENYPDTLHECTPRR